MNRITLKLNTVTITLVFITCVLYPPFTLYNFVAWEVRVFSLMLAFLCALLTARYSKEASPRFLLALLVYVFLLTLSSDPLEKYLRSILGYSATLIFGFALFNFIRTHKEAKTIFLKYYDNLSYIIVLSMLCSIVYYTCFGEIEIINLKPDGHEMIQTPFGFLFSKSFSGIEILRASSYFSEPSFAGIYFAINVAAISHLTNRFSRKTLLVNIVGGVLTFSWTFYCVAYLLFILGRGYIWVIISSMLTIIVLSFADSVLPLTSIAERLMRARLFYDAYFDSPTASILFGNGIIQPDSFTMGFGSGLLNVLYESGMTGLMFYLIVLYYIFRRLLMTIAFVLISATNSIINTPLLLIALTVFYSRKYKERS